ncbi:hypothetical protein GGR56DRAFT_384911 [Xylariaceae sp. FL0804]|nr:hypothetical protein GGR56DRAFT_384911 [Xylariaceae sp. FL0804]
MKHILVTTTIGLFGALAAATSSVCPYNYPIQLNATDSKNGLVFTVASTNPITNNRAIQLRPSDAQHPGSTSSLAGIDATSPVLLANLVDGGLYSEARNEDNQLYALGPTGRLDLRDETDSTARYGLAFANATGTTTGADTAWQLTAIGSDGTYALYHSVPVGVVNGFVLCSSAEADAAAYELFYYEYEGTAADLPGCEFISLRTTVAPVIFNGACDIGGIEA